jgi:pimeloyl-ACP methyl ester carboxylesterase
MPYCNELFYRSYENGEIDQKSTPLVLLHGSGGSHMAWPVEMRRINGQRVIALDLPAHGRSAGPACQSLDSLSIHLHRFFQDCGTRKIILAGHSLGAILALAYACAHPGQVRGIVLLSCGSRFSIPPALFEALQQARQKTQFIEQFNSLVFDASFPQSERRAILEPLVKIDTSLLLMDVRICANYQLPGNLDKLTCPVMLVNGASDPITTPASARQLAYSLPKAALTILPQCGHMFLYEKTTRISLMLRDFLVSLR